MLTETYIEALLVDDDLAEQVQAALMAGQIDGETMILACYWLEENYPGFGAAARKDSDDY
ncbi:MAG: hypothetical protein IIA10_06670 [Proteobacteria bacterium]|nr:hypothetical protein [Pseudomonadota bacterium]